MNVSDEVKEAWLDYTSANPFQAEYILIKYLNLLTDEERLELLENFGRTHSALIKRHK